MQNLPFRLINRLRESYWFWPSVLTVAAIALGILLPLTDRLLGPQWAAGITFVHTSEPEGARAILTTLASAILGVGGVAFSITIVAVSFASSNYGPRLIGNFMADRINQFVLGTFVATFVYCVVVLTTVHDSSDVAEIGQFVPQLSIYVALVLGIISIAALIAYIHHIPESINIMNLTETIGTRLCGAVIAMLDEEAMRDRADANAEAIDIAPWREGGVGDTRAILPAPRPGFLQQFDLAHLGNIARECGVQITLERSPGEFVASHDALISVRPAGKLDDALRQALGAGYTLGAQRTDVQDVLFLSDQLVEVLVRALSPGVNDPNTAMLCLGWLRAGLSDFARRPPSPPTSPYAPLRYSRVTFEAMLDRSFDRMRRHIAGDRTVTLAALAGLADIAAVAVRAAMAEACVRQMKQLATSAMELQAESIAKTEIDDALAAALQRVAQPRD